MLKLKLSKTEIEQNPNCEKSQIVTKKTPIVIKTHSVRIKEILLKKDKLVQRNRKIEMHEAGHLQILSDSRRLLSSVK